MRNFDVIVIGGGAAGVMAAGVASMRGCSVLLCEKMEKPQRKVRITGKGRCNLTNMCSAEEFLSKVRSGADFFSHSLGVFSNQDTVDFFENIGVPLTIERGKRVFPTSSKAWDIADAHVRWCQQQGVVIENHAEVKNIYTEHGVVCGVELLPQHGKPAEKISAHSVVVATGGLSYPATGSTGAGLMMAHGLGHSIVEVRPSLTPLETEPRPSREMKGLSLRNVSVALYIDDKEISTEFGEMEFTDKGVSGPVVLRLSRKAVDAIIDEHKVELSIDLKPALSLQKLSARIARERETLPQRATVKDLIAKLLPSAMIAAFLEICRLTLKMPVRELTQSDEELITATLKNFKLKISDYRPFEEAIVTAGGVSLDEIDPLTMASHKVKGLFFAGEVLDLDADTGGYNLQIAYSTGYVAGEAIAKFNNKI